MGWRRQLPNCVRMECALHRLQSKHIHPLSQGDTDHPTQKQGSALDLYAVNPGVILTGVEAHQKDRLIRLTTTRELLWLDVRSPNRPLLSVRHNRDSDRTLRSHTRTIGKGMLSRPWRTQTGVSLCNISPCNIPCVAARWSGFRVRCCTLRRHHSHVLSSILAPSSPYTRQWEPGTCLHSTPT